MMRFTLFGIPITVEPWFWVTSFVFGGGIHLLGAGANQAQFLSVAVWMVVVFLSILIHELGHALTSRHVGGAVVWIKLTAFCGLAYSQGARMTRNQRAFMAFMGPAAGFLLLLVTFLTCCILHGFGLSWDIFVISNLSFFGPLLGEFNLSLPYNNYNEVVAFIQNPESTLKFRIFSSFFFINFFWGLINLLPVMPLDGGHIMNEYTKSQKKVYLISAVTALTTCLLGVLFLNSMLMAIFFGMFAFQNYTAYKESKY